MMRVGGLLLFPLKMCGLFYFFTFGITNAVDTVEMVAIRSVVWTLLTKKN